MLPSHSDSHEPGKCGCGKFADRLDFLDFPDADDVARGMAAVEFDARVALPEAQERFKRAEVERDRLRAGIQWARGICTDESYVKIDAFLGGLLNA